MFNQVPTLKEVGVEENIVANKNPLIIGGESVALEQMVLRLKAEEEAFLKGLYRPLQARPDLLGPPLALSAAIAIGAISVRLYSNIAQVLLKSDLIIIFFNLNADFIGRFTRFLMKLTRDLPLRGYT